MPIVVIRISSTLLYKASLSQQRLLQQAENPKQFGTVLTVVVMVIVMLLLWIVSTNTYWRNNKSLIFEYKQTQIQILDYYQWRLNGIKKHYIFDHNNGKAIKYITRMKYIDAMSFLSFVTY